jgi:Tol biopolymer transport system component
MGEVFKARDPRLNRDVAIKVLPELFASDPDRLARFEREAQVLASLNHPNIAHVHGLEESLSTGAGHPSGRRALVMEFVEGRTLADVIGATGGHGIPVIDALPIARQIAEALDVAHEKGIVHRDLKPANVLLTPDGTVKVLDFGLAKALEPTQSSQTELMNSPTFTGPGAGTGLGVVLGTASYMAPEQARGLAVDRRADIWAFGIVLFELLTGRHAFEGGTATDIVAAVITRDPEWDRLPPSLPEPVVRVLHRCLEKDPKRRMRDIGDARAEIEAATGQYSTPQRASVAVMASPGRAVPAWVWAAGVVLALAAGAAIGRFALTTAQTASTPVRFEIILPERARAVISPDGTRLALTSSKGLLVRDLDRLEDRLLAGTEAAESPFWVDDSTTLMYGAKGKLWRVSVAGGAPTPIGTLPGGAWDHDAGGTLISDGGIVFTNGSSPLMRMPAGGGDPTTLVPVNDAEELHFHNVSGLPDGRGFVFATHRKPGADTIEVWTGTERRKLARFEGSVLHHPVYSGTGHVLFTRAGTSPGLWAVPFSLSTFNTTGQPFLVDAVAAEATISRTSRLSYVPAATLPPSRLTWFDREGRQIGRLEELRVFDRVPALSPDGALVAVSERTEDQWDVWTVELKTGARKRLTADGFARNPGWTPDGKSIIYTSLAPNVPPTLKRVAADGSGLLEDIGPGRDASVTSDGKTVFYWRDFDLFHRPLGGGTEVPFLTEADADIAPRPSPDGRFVAYLRMERNTLGTSLFVKPFAGGEAVGLKTRTRNYRWSSDGHRLFVADDDATVMEVDVQTDPRLRIGVPRKLFSLRPLGTSSSYPGFEVSSDGQRFLTVQSEPEAAIQRVVVVLDFKPGK